jgi:hypothetical protein
MDPTGLLIVAAIIVVIIVYGGGWGCADQLQPHLRDKASKYEERLDKATKWARRRIALLEPHEDGEVRKFIGGLRQNAAEAEQKYKLARARASAAEAVLRQTQDDETGTVEAELQAARLMDDAKELLRRAEAELDDTDKRFAPFKNIRTKLSRAQALADDAMRWMDEEGQRIQHEPLYGTSTIRERAGLLTQELATLELQLSG